MFDKLIESNSVQADFKPRRKFFMVSSVLVGIAFLTAVVFSLYAQDLDLGTNDFEITRMLAPIVADAPEPEPPRQQSQTQERNEQAKTELPSRQQLIARIDQPQKAPTEISTTPFRGMTIPDGAFTVNPYAPETNGRAAETGTGTSSTGSGGPEVADSTPMRVVEPPPIIPKTEAPKSRTQSKGVVNGIALSLPKPPYPPPAKAINLTGTVNVQVLIDESGDVVSARAVDGHLLFRAEAERAARKAKFRPTLLSDQPVKVTGVIVYRFSR
ncbi:MAG TPA: TonB family protein [Pyrinomonadaceae bacterium]